VVNQTTVCIHHLSFSSLVSKLGYFAAKKPLQTFVFSATLALSEDARKNLRKQGKKIKKPKKKAEESADVLGIVAMHTPLSEPP